MQKNKKNEETEAEKFLTDDRGVAGELGPAFEGVEGDGLMGVATTPFDMVLLYPLVGLRSRRSKSGSILDADTHFEQQNFQSQRIL